MPLLHRPTFEQSIAHRLHLQDIHFAATVILVCAIGVGFSEDPRVTALPYDHPRASGWTWFHQAQEMYLTVLFKPSLYIIQAYCVSSIPSCHICIF